MNDAMGFPSESARQTCYRLRWALASAGFTLAACMIFIGIILILPSRPETHTLGVFLLISSAVVILFGILLPLAARAVKKRRPTEGTTPSEQHARLPQLASEDDDDDDGGPDIIPVSLHDDKAGDRDGDF